MFTGSSREALKAELIARARKDRRVVAAALLGSSSTEAEDRWSDIDLALSVPPNEHSAAIESWTADMYERHQAVHHVDVFWNRTLYRVFLLSSTLQVDLSFWSSADFVATGPRFRLLFGEQPPKHTTHAQSDETLIGYGWLYLLHIRSSIERGRPWQANYMLAQARNHILELACRRHDLQGHEARGVDDLPTPLLDEYVDMVPDSLQPDALRQALAATTAVLLNEATLGRTLADEALATVQSIGSLSK